MRKPFLLLTCLLTTFLIYAQQRTGGQQMSGRFYGKVVESKSNKGIEAVSVQLLQSKIDTATKTSKDVVVGGMLTMPNGDFSIENVPMNGKYKLKVTTIGFIDYEKPVAFTNPGDLDKDLGNIKLQIDEKVLGAVTVSASKPLFQLGIDRKIFNVDKNIVSTGGTAVDVMRNVPSLNVDIDGNVTLRNNAPQIFVDGRPTNLTLEQIPADAIESVEIITNPSAKFDASGGTSGILNIVLKKNKRVGYSGNIRANIDSRGRVGAGGDINIRQNKINIFAGGNFNQRKSISTGTTDRTTFGDTSTHTIQNDKSTMTGVFGFGRGGIDYFIDNRNTLTLTGTVVRGKMSPATNSDIYDDSLVNNTIISSKYNYRTSNSENLFRNWGTQLSFKHNFPKAGREWTADVNYNKGKNNNENIIQNEYFKMPQGAFDGSYKQLQIGGGTNDNLVLQTDYTNPINEKSKFEMGGRTSVRKVNSTTNYYSVNADGSRNDIPGQNVIYNSNDRIYAAYASYSSRVKNFGYQLGLRAESSNYEGRLPEKNQFFTIEFPISFFPSVFLSQKLSETDDLQLNYSRRINRPGFWQLFPFTDYSDSLNISRGNPFLKPEFTNSLELSYSKMFKNRDNLIASVYFKNTNDLITRFQTKESDTFLKKDVIISTYINANRSYVTGLEVISKNKMTKWWDITANANLFTSKIDLIDQPDPDQFFSYFFKLNNSFKMFKVVTLQISADYQSKITSSPGGSSSRGGGGFGGGGGGMFGGGNSAAQGFIRPNYGVDAALRFEFLKAKTASISLNINDIFRTRKYDAHTESVFFRQDIIRRRDPQILRLNFNLRFGKMDVNLFKRKNNRTEDSMDNVNF
jgi:outer membrane receptor protein involved in Fe transport